MGIDERHVALAAFHCRACVALVIPVARGPVVILVLQLDPTDPIHFLINKLLVAGSAVFGFLVHALAQAVVGCRPCPDQKIPHNRSGSALRAPLPQILRWLNHRIVRVALNVRLLDRMACQTGNPFVVAL